MKMATKAQTVSVATRLPASADEVWEKLQQVDTLKYIAAPYATFEPAGNTTPIWVEGSTTKYRLWLFGFIPLGIHTICVKQIDKSMLEIFTNECNKYVPAWNHRIALQKTSDAETCHYRDEVEISAGWKTPIVAAWCKLFYRHRQKMWRRLLDAQKAKTARYQ